MPEKRSAYGYFTNGEKAYEPFLKATGWKSEYRSVQKLLNHLARRIKSEGSRESYLSWLYRFCRKVGKDPEQIIAMDPSSIRETVQDFVDDCGASNPETGNLARAALTAFLKSNGFDGGDRNVIRIRGFFSPARKAIEMSDYVPTREEIYRMAGTGRVNNIRDRAAVLVLYTSGLRQGTLRALRYRDIRQELQDGVVPLKIPVYPEMKQVVSDACKGNVPYYTFITQEAIDALKAHLGELEAQIGRLGDDDVIFNGWKRNRYLRESRPKMGRSTMMFLVKNAARRAGLERWMDVHPHCLRKAFESALREDNADGRKLDVKTQEFLLGHILPGSQENYYDRSKVDWLRKEYAKLNFTTSQSFSRGDVLAAIRREMLATRYSEEELDQLGDLSKLTTEQFVEVLNKKALGLNGNGKQKVVPVGDVRTMVEKGWEYVAQLPDGSVVMRMPGGSGS
ncbi:MAG: tyrosine-type recombinase/integrase [Nitrososphaerales archaeon]